MLREISSPYQPELVDVLSLAEAAAWVGVGHLALRTRLDSAEVQLVAGMRGGRALRLVRVCDLRVVFPSVATKPSPGSKWFTEVDPEGEVPGAVFAGLSKSRSAVGYGPAPFIDPVGQEPASRGSHGASGSPSGETTRYLRQQLKRTRAEVVDTKDENLRLKRELLSSADAVKSWLDCVRDDAPGRVAPVLNPPSAQADRRDAPAAQAGPRFSPPVHREISGEMSWHNRLALPAGVLLVVAGLVAGSGIVGGLGWGSPEMGLDHASVPRLQAQADAPPGRWMANEVIAAGYGVPPAVHEPDPFPERPTAGSGEVPSDAEPVIAAQDATDDSPLVPDRAATPMVVVPGSALMAASMGPSIVDGVGEACQYFALTRPGMEGRSLVGPCQGVWSSRLGAVTASHHRSEHSACRGHAHFDRAMGGSMIRASEMAMVAKAEGLLSPLLGLRVERSAASMIREEVPVWIQSGFESGLLGVEHLVEPMDTADHWRVRSWVRYLDFAGVEMKRRFELRLALGDGPRGDVVLSLEWQED